MAISVAEDWIEGRGARKRREVSAKWEELKKKTNTLSQRGFKSLITMTFSAQSSSYLT